jgi:hypothetical protein
MSGALSEVWQYQLFTTGAHAINALESDDAKKLVRNTAALRNVRLIFRSFIFYLRFFNKKPPIF